MLYYVESICTGNKTNVETFCQVTWNITYPSMFPRMQPDLLCYSALCVLFCNWASAVPSFCKANIDIQWKLTILLTGIALDLLPPWIKDKIKDNHELVEKKLWEIVVHWKINNIDRKRVEVQHSSFWSKDRIKQQDLQLISRLKWVLKQLGRTG